MIKIIFSDADVCNLRHERTHHPHPSVRNKMDALYLKSQGISHKDICRIVNITKPTLVSYLRAYCEGEVERLKEINFYRPKSALEDYAELIEYHFENRTFATLAEAQHEIEKLTGIHLSTSQIGKFLKRLGMKRRKIGSIPGKAITDDKIKEQEEFKKTSWNLDLKKRKQVSG